MGKSELFFYISESDNMECTNTYRQMAIRYFNGNLSLTEEKELFLFVKKTPENEYLYRQWEADWLKSPKQILEVDAEWVKLQRRMSFRFATDKKPIVKHRWVQMIAAVMIGLVFLAGGFVGVRYYGYQMDENNQFALKTDMAEKACLHLADGTTVYLNAGSSLRYSGNFNTRNREVVLSGEAYFEVSKLPGDIPFTVKTESCDVVVKGTKFNVTAYPEDKLVSTVLISGAVDVMYQGKQISIKPGELVSINKATGIFSKENVQKEQYMAWTEGRFEYDKISLQELMDRLSRKYDVTIHLDDKIKSDVVFRISLRNEETIDDILAALVQLIPIQYEKKGREIYIWE